MVAHAPELDTISLIGTGKDGRDRVTASIRRAARTSFAVCWNDVRHTLFAKKTTRGPLP